MNCIGPWAPATLLPLNATHPRLHEMDGGEVLPRGAGGGLGRPVLGQQLRRRGRRDDPPVRELRGPAAGAGRIGRRLPGQVGRGPEVGVDDGRDVGWDESQHLGLPRLTRREPPVRQLLGVPDPGQGRLRRQRVAYRALDLGELSRQAGGVVGGDGRAGDSGGRGDDRCGGGRCGRRRGRGRRRRRLGRNGRAARSGAPLVLRRRAGCGHAQRDRGEPVRRSGHRRNVPTRAGRNLRAGADCRLTQRRSSARRR